MEKKVFPCNSEGMAGAQAFMETLCPEPKPAIIMDEVVSNIVRCSGASDFSIVFDRVPEGIKMVFTDNGTPFDPTTEVAPPDISTPAAERDIGGLGIFMVKKMSKSVAYNRESDKNVLTVVL